MEADVVFLRSHPTLDVRNVRQVESVLVDVALHRAADLLEAAAALAATPES